MDAKSNKPSDWGQLMEQAQNGNRNAYSQLLSEITPVILVRLRRSMPQHIAEDLSQEVLISIHRHLHTFQPGRPFAPWLMTITANRMKDYFRSSDYKIRFEDLDTVDFAPRRIEDDNSTAERLSMLESEMHQLSQKQRDAILLTKIQGLSLKEAAKQMNSSEGSVKLLVHRGVTHLKTIFGVKEK